MSDRNVPVDISQRAQRSQRRTVLAATFFVVFVCVALLAVDLWLALRARDQEIRRATTANTNLAQAVSQQVDSMFSEVGNVLSGIAYELERGDVDTALAERLQPVLVNHVATNANLHDLFVFDARGAWRVTSQAAIPASANNADRQYFIHHRDNPSEMKFIGKPIVSRSTGVWVIPVSRRFNDRDGNFAGVVLATIAVDHLRQMISEFQIGQQGALGLMLEDGTILVRRPFAVEDLGSSIAGSEVYSLFRQGRSGTAESVSPLDGVERLVSFRHVKNQPMVVAVALSKREMLEDWRETTYFQTGWILVLCGFIGVLGGYVVRSVRQRLQVERSLGRTRDELTDANERLARLARHDGLTSLPNRRYFDEVLETAFAASSRSGLPLALVMIDVDHFKRYNDLYGHPEGDRCLQQVAQAIQSAARRPRDFVARYGGEEMVMVLPDTDLAGASVVAETARAAVARLALPHAASTIARVSVSAGVAVHVPQPGAPTTAQALLRQADGALYEAKEAGRDRVCVREAGDNA